jgi:hypothetical protein
LNPDELQTISRRALLFEAQLNRFPNPQRDFIQGPRLRMASGELWDRSDVVPLLIAFNDDVELALQKEAPRFSF